MRTIQPPEYEVRCPRCRAVLGVSGHDIEVDDSGIGPYYSITCPHCREGIELQRNQIPHYVRAEINEPPD